MTKSETSPEELSFEEALTELEEIVNELEQGETSLDDSIARFDRGVGLARRCEDRLNEAEKKISVLLTEGSRIIEVDMATGEQREVAEDPGDEILPSPGRSAPPPAPPTDDDDDIPF